MSTDSRTVPRTVSTSLEETVDASVFRTLALAGMIVLTGAYVHVLADITRTVGGTQSLYLLVLTMAVTATVLAHAIQPRTALAIGLGAGAIGFLYYLEATGHGAGAMILQADTFLSDTITLATGMSILQMVEAGIWTLGFAPGPVFLSWYLVMRERYALSVVPGGIALVFLVLTTDATTGVTVVGVVGGIAAVGFGELDHRGGTIAQADVLAILFAVIVVLSMTITFVPGGAASPTFLVDSGPSTLDGAIDSDPDRTSISGSVDLSPEVHFTVVSEEPTYWRTGVYDRYTGDAWVRSGPDDSYNTAGLPTPEGEYDTVRQTVTIERQLHVMPVSPHPTAIEGDIAEHVSVTDHGQPMPDGPVIEGDTYNVESAVIRADPEELTNAGTDYPEHVTDYYLQTPETLSSEFETATADIVGDAETPYEKAVAIEQHFHDEYDYSLEVDRPGGNAAEEFLFEMDEGYCVYFATTMAQMLRAEEIPARYVTGYTSGQQVDDHEYVVRGLDAHAWVEVYFPEHGWVAFEPTPSSERDTTHQERLEQAREDGEANVDTDTSEDVPADGIEDEEPDIPEPDDDFEDIIDQNDSDSNQSSPGMTPGYEGLDPGGEGGTTDGSDLLEPSDPGSGLPDSDAGTDGAEEEDEGIPVAPGDLLLGVALFIGVAAGVRRSGVPSLVNREVRLYWHGFRADPVADTERAYDRLEVLLARRYRPRKRGESPRQYLESLRLFGTVDPRARRVTKLYEQARYGGGVDREAADEAVSLVSELAREQTPVVGRLWR
ncbi:transglutaminase domain-containing protein [Natronosalvus vescus]|uniref:transglutaminase domain-containing protein n=1 Tax=Natronosalvus vescus TaxID=2953881 RepID=UPI002091CF61|nr:transglutaminaseTgpA domain-containing protein [Natronosalvus vescus]